MNFPAKRFAVLFVAALAFSAGAQAHAGAWLVENGEARAAIVVADDAPRLAALAAEELQAYLARITGARLPIVHAPDPAYPATVFVGRSPWTDELEVTDEGLAHGAYRIVSRVENHPGGRNCLVLLGRDRDYHPVEPWSRNRNDFERTQAAWEEFYGGPCAHPLNWYGGTVTSFNREMGIWRQDESGSLQAVYAFLRELGVRWYWPGETGEVVPRRATVALPEVDRTVRPDFSIRNLIWYGRFHGANRDDVLWWLRLGLNDGYSVLGASMLNHGMRMIHGNRYMQENHPEYFALHGGTRETTYRGTGHACFSSEGLQRETVKYVRAVFDHFNEPAVDLWPQDGLRHCGCELCADKSHSEAVWGFIDRVARELYETHPDRLITGGAYATYVQPPENITQFSPNVAVKISNRGRRFFDVPARWHAYWELIQAWESRLAPGRLFRGENNRGGPIHPRAFAKDLRALKGISFGESGEILRSHPDQPTRWPNPARNHLNYYVHANLMWDADQDLDALLNEYYRLFYGPAANAMQAAFEFAEQNYDRTGRRGGLDLPREISFIEQVQAALALAGDDVYAARIRKLLDELPPLKDLRAELQAQQDAGNPRDKAPVVVARRLDADTEPETHTFRPRVAWRHRESAVPLPTSFSVAWDDDALYFEFDCLEPDMANLELTDNVWEGDSVLIFLETPRHSHYLVQVAPDGRVFDADRNDAGRLLPQWSAQAEVETDHDADRWRVRVRLPLAVIGAHEEFGDPLHQVVAPRPGEGDWFFNVGRTRVRDGRRLSGEQGYAPFAFSPSDEPMHLEEIFPPRHFARLVFEQGQP